MKKFVFDLEDILSFRRFEQQQAEMELAKALAAEKEVQDKIDVIAIQLAGIKNQMKGSVDFAAIANANNFYLFAEQQTEYLFKQISELKIVTEQKRDVLRKAMQKTDSLEKLKEQQYSEYKKTIIKEEDQVIDEIVTTRSSYKN